MKKVSFLMLHLGFGGAEKANTELANMLADTYEVELLCSYRIQDQPAFPLDDRIQIHYLMDCVPNRQELQQAIKSKNPVAILREGWKSMHVLRQRKKTMISAIQACDSDIIISDRVLFTKWLGKYKNDHCITIAQEHNDPLGDPDMIEAIADSCNSIDYFMPVSQFITDFFTKKLASNPIDVVYIPHVLDFYPDHRSDETGGNIVSIGRLSPEKGFPDLIDVFALVHRECPELTLDLIGDGEDREMIERKLVQHGLKDCVRIHGYQRKPYIQELLSHAMMYAMSSYKESFGIVLLEAQAYGLPCVAFSSARGACELIHEDNGCLIEQRDHQAMADCLIHWYLHEEERRTLGEGGRKQAIQYTRDSIQTQWISFLANAKRR